jgi:predicted O-linked N-acetylglucosamine transferase (SPINDLY family)
MTLIIAPLPEREKSAGAKIRVGHLSVDFCNHAVAQLIVELIERHDRNRFEIIGYSYGPDDGGALRRRLMQGFVRFVDIRTLSNLDAASLIRRNGVDILVDLTGYTANARTEMLAYRPAPAQVNFLGYPPRTIWHEAAYERMIR